MDYADVKLVHQVTVALSFLGFFARGTGSLADAAWVKGRVARTLPHIVDTLLLASAIALAWMLRLPLLDTPWLLAKIVGLLAYIALGIVALKPGRPLSVRAAAWVGAICVFVYIVSVALTKDPRGFLAG